MHSPKVSLITACFNKEATIQESLNSVREQSYPNIEHIIIDGASADNSLTLINESIMKNPNCIIKVISEPDTGIYNALNKGITMASGDIIGVLHADDFFAHPDTIANVVKYFLQTKADCVYGDLQYVSKSPPYYIIRHWKSEPFMPSKLKRGWMPPHPTLFVKTNCYSRIGLYNERYRISADYDFILRLFSLPFLQPEYLPEVITRMRIGGASNSVQNILRKSLEDYLAIKGNRTGGLTTLALKNILKLSQFFVK